MQLSMIYALLSIVCSLFQINIVLGCKKISPRFSTMRPVVKLFSFFSFDYSVVVAL